MAKALQPTSRGTSPLSSGATVNLASVGLRCAGSVCICMYRRWQRHVPATLLTECPPWLGTARRLHSNLFCVRNFQAPVWQPGLQTPSVITTLATSSPAMWLHRCMPQPPFNPIDPNLQGWRDLWRSSCPDHPRCPSSSYRISAKGSYHAQILGLQVAHHF